MKLIKRKKIYENKSVSIKPVITDLDGDRIELSVENPPNGSVLSGGVLNWTPDFDIASRGVNKDVVITFVANG